MSIDLIGFLITIVNALAIVVYMLLSEKLLENRQDKLLSTNWVMVDAMVAGLLMIPFFALSTPVSAIGWILLFSLGVFGTMLPILAINYALQLMGAGSFDLDDFPGRSADAATMGRGHTSDCSHRHAPAECG